MATRVQTESAQRTSDCVDRAPAQAALLREPGAQAPAPRRSEPGDARERRARDPLLAQVGGRHRFGMSSRPRWGASSWPAP